MLPLASAATKLLNDLEAFVNPINIWESLTVNVKWLDVSAESRAFFKSVAIVCVLTAVPEAKVAVVIFADIVSPLSNSIEIAYFVL